METTKFFGVRMARGASHLVVPEPPKPVVAPTLPEAPVSTPPVKSRRRRTAKSREKNGRTKKATPIVSGSLFDHQPPVRKTNKVAKSVNHTHYEPDQTAPPLSELVGYFESEQSDEN